MQVSLLQQLYEAAAPQPCQHVSKRPNPSTDECLKQIVAVLDKAAPTLLLSCSPFKIVSFVGQKILTCGEFDAHLLLLDDRVLANLLGSRVFRSAANGVLGVCKLGRLYNAASLHNLPEL